MRNEGQLRPILDRPGPVARSASERFAQKTSPLPNGCIVWTGGKTAGGYGMFAPLTDGEPAKVMAHRWAYEHAVGAIPAGLDIDHLCRNRACVNPVHLEPVTREENIRRAAAVKTHCPHGHEYTPENTYVRPGTVHRHCRTCAHDQELARANQKNARRRQRRAELKRGA